MHIDADGPRQNFVSHIQTPFYYLNNSITLTVGL